MLEFEILEEVAEQVELLDLDPRYWDANEGSIQWGEAVVYFTKSDDVVTLSLGAVEVTVARP